MAGKEKEQVIIRFPFMTVPTFSWLPENDLGGAGMLFVYRSLTGETLISLVMKERN